MSGFVLRLFLLISCFLGSLACAQGGRNGQQVPVNRLVRLDEIEAEAVNSPEYEVDVRGMSVQGDGRKEWLMVRAEYRTAQEWFDEVTVTFYVVLRGDPENMPEGSKPVNMFTGTVTYINVPQGEHEATMFLDANTFARYGEPTHVAALINIRGELAAGGADPESSARAQWWNQESPHEISLLPRNETPWAFIEIDKHDTIKP